MTTNNRIETGLKPRAIAVLCALRNGALTARQLCTRIGDAAINETHDLLSDMSIGHMRRPDLRMFGDRTIACRDGLWRLSEDGVGWLADNGLRFSDRGWEALGL